MKKILLLMTMVLTCVGAWAQAELDGCYVTFTNVQQDGTEYSLYVNDQKQLTVSRDPASSLGEYSKFICTKVGDKYKFYNEKSGMYMVWRNAGTAGPDGGDGTMATYNSTYCDWALRPSTNYPGGYYIVSKRANGNAGAIVLLSGGVFDAYGDSEGWASDHSNIFRIEKVGETIYPVNMNNGTLHKDGTGSEANWNSKWASKKTEPAQLTLTTGANNIGKSNGNLMLASGKSGTSVYTLAVPEGYVIKSYRFNFVLDITSTVTIAPEGGTTMTANSESQELFVENINASSTTFTLSGANNPITTSNFVVVISKKTEPNMTFSWNNSTPWADVTNYTSTVLNDEVLGNVKYIETELTTESATDATVTFQYTTGNCALNIRGVEVVNKEGLIVAGDYHVGKAGGAHENNVYTVSVAEAGTYKVRLYATFDGENRAEDTNGTITIQYTEADVADFSHSMSITAGYATLYLGYPVAIPTGVEAYVVSDLTSTHAIMTEVENVIPANTGVILKLADGAAATETYTFEYTDAEAAEIETNLLEGSIANRYVASDAYVLSNGTNGIGLYRADLNQLDKTAFLNNAHKVYLPAPTSGVKALRFNFDGETTAIETVETENAKAPIYDLSGRRVLSTVKGGIYIQNGKKFIVK